MNAAGFSAAFWFGALVFGDYFDDLLLAGDLFLDCRVLDGSFRAESVLGHGFVKSSEFQRSRL